MLLVILVILGIVYLMHNTLSVHYHTELISEFNGQLQLS